MSRSPASIRKRRSFRAWLRRKVGVRGSTVRDIPSDNLSKGHRGVFGVPLMESIKYAHRNMLYHDEDNVVHRHVGAIPVLVAKTGAYLKNNCLDTIGVFRLSGGHKRVAALQELFDRPPYGSNVDWSDATPHDVATLLRRFLNQLPDPVIPHAHYKAFRDVMSNKCDETSPTQQWIDEFQSLIEKLPIPHQHLLLYLLDLLSLFSRHADENKMTSANLAAVFSPAILSHPDHNTAEQYKISQAVIEFLIEFQNLFTIKMVTSNNNDSSSRMTKICNGINDPPPVPPLPDWVVANKHRNVYAERRQLPHLDTAHVNSSYVKGDGDIFPDSGADVKTPILPFSIHQRNDILSLPSPEVPSQPERKTSWHGHATYWHQALQKIPKQLATMAGAAVAMLLAGTSIYRGFCLGNLINWMVFVGGLGAYWALLIAGLATQKIEKNGLLLPAEHKDEDVEETGIGDASCWMDDKASETAMLDHDSVVDERGDILRGTWRNEICATPTSLLLSRNRSASDYFDLEQDQGDKNADRTSMLTVGSRYMEDSGSDEDTSHSGDDDDDDDDDETWRLDLTDEDLHRLWCQFQQIEKDQAIAEELQRQEEEAERQLDEETNPFVGTPIKPRNTHEETWKIASVALSTNK